MICERARPPCNKCGIRTQRLCDRQNLRGIDYFHSPAEPVLPSADPLKEALVAKEPTVPKDIASLSFGSYTLASGVKQLSLSYTVIAGSGNKNVAILYGFGLIVAALFLALVYAWLCRERKPPLNSEPPG